MNDVIQRERWINVRWIDNNLTHFRATIDIVAHDRTSLVADVSVTLANMRVPIHEFNARELKNGDASITVTVDTQGKEHLETIIQKLNKVNGVISAERSGK